MSKYKVTGMSCAACSARVERAVSSVEGVTACTVNLLTGTVQTEGTAADEAIIAAVEAAGYGAFLEAEENSFLKKQEKDEETSRLKRRILSSLFFLLLLMYLSMGHMMLSLPLPQPIAEDPLAIAFLQMALAAMVMGINYRFFQNGIKGALHLAPNMDTLVSLGSAASFLYSTAVLVSMIRAVHDGNHAEAHEALHGLYFESAAMILVLITLGKLLEARAKGKTKGALQSLIDLSPKFATVKREGLESRILATDLRVGDIFTVKPGESFPADGEILFGHTSIDESALTGEGLPRDKSVGDSVYTATVNRAGYVECRATKTGEDTSLATMIQTVADAAAGKAPIAKLADKVSGIFVPAVLAIALLCTLIWLLLGRELGFALARGISVLVISCPCALGLATPVAIMVASGKGAKNHILFKNAAAIEAIGRIGTVALDKTGTLTVGAPLVTDVLPFGEETSEGLMILAYSLERISEHPLAKAVCQKAKTLSVNFLAAEGIEIFPGGGLCGTVEGRIAYGGNLTYIKDKTQVPTAAEEKATALATEGKTPLFFAWGDRFLGILAVSDEVKEASAEAVRHLREQGIRTVLLTGDNEKVAHAVAAAVGVDEVYAELLPNQKAQTVEALKKGGSVAMVGDGINDAAALVAADVGIAIGAGTDIAIDAADAVLMKSDPLDIPAAIRLGRATLRIIKQNLFWAFAYNAVGIPLAAGAFISLLGWEMNPMFCAAAMSVSSFIVVSNALRLNTVKLYKEEKATEKEKQNMKKTMVIEGLMCPHCEARVKKILEGIEGVALAEVSFKSGTATLSLEKPVEDSVLKAAVESENYPVKEIR